MAISPSPGHAECMEDMEAYLTAGTFTMAVLPRRVYSLGERCTW